MLTALILVLFTISRNANTTQTLANNNLPETTIEAPTETIEVSAEEQINSNSIHFQRWLENEVKIHVNEYAINSQKYDLEIEMVVSKEGKLTSYKIKKSISNELSLLLDNILADAPRFEPVKMNGYAARMCYKVPVSIVVR